METLSIEINNPKAKKLLKDLADLKLITIKPKTTLNVLAGKLRENYEDAPSLEEIAEVVEQVRLSRNAKKA